MQLGRSRLGRSALAIVAVVAATTAVDLAVNESPAAFAAYCGQSTDSFCGFGLTASQQLPYCYATEVPIDFTLTSQSTAPQTSSAYVAGTYTYPGGGAGTWRMNIGGPIATTTQSPYHTGPSWGLNNAGNPFAIFNGDLGRTNLFLTPTNSPASAELVQLRPNADADYLNGARNTFANHTNHWTFDRTYIQYRLEDPSNQTTRTTGVYPDTALLYQRTALDNRLSTYVVTGDTGSLWVQDHGGSAYEGWSQSAVAKYTTCLTVSQTGAYVDANNNGYPDPGDHVKFTYVLTNPGSAELSGLNLVDAGVTMSASNVTVPGGSSVTVTGTYPLTANDILNGSVTRNAKTSGVDLLGNAVSDIADSPVVATNADPEGDGEPDDPTTVLLPPPPIDLGVTKTDDADPVRDGDTITYTISVVNNGPGTIDPGDTFIVYDEIPTGLIDPQYAAPAPAVWDGPTGEISGVKLAPGETIELTVTAIAATTGATVENKVTVKSPTGDPDNTNDVAVETTTILPKADLKVTKSAVPSPVVAGTEITWTITVANGGPDDATNVIVSDVIPPEVSSPTVIGCAFAGDSCNVGTIPAGASATITITALVSEDTPAGTEIDNSAVVAADTEDPDPTNNTSASKTPVSSEADVVLIKSSSPNPYVPGEPITYTFTVHNSGPSTAIGVVLKDSFPGGLSGFSADDPTCSFSGSEMACDIEKIGVGDTITITVTADTDPGLVDPIVNEAFVDVSNDPNVDNNVSVDENGPNPQADLRVVKTDAADPVLAGDSIVYTVSVTNLGPSVATGVELYDDFVPSGLGLTLNGVPTVTAGGGNCTVGSCVFPELAVGETAVVNYTIDVPEDVASGTTITNTAKAGSAVSDPDDANNIADETTGITTQADLSITKVGDNAPVAGQNFTYTLTVANAGPSVAGTTVVTDELPAGVTFVAAGSSPACSVSGTLVSCDVPSLASGDQTEIVIEVAVDPAFVGTLANTAMVAAGSNAPDPDTSNNTATHAGVASAEADLGVSKSVNKTSAAAGTALEWIVVVTNNGPSTAASVALDDIVPPGVTVTSVTSTVGGSTCTSVSSCALGDLAPGDVATITITGDIEPGLADGTQLVNVASVSSATTDPNSTNDDAQVATAVASVADVSLVKTATPNPYTPGSPLAFTISAINLGPSSAVGASFVDDLPQNFSYTGYTVAAGSGSCNLSGATLTCAADPMAPGAEFTVVVNGDTDAGTIAAMSNTASMTTPTAYTDPEPGNDLSTVTVGSTPNADVGISKTSVGSTTPGTTKRWTVTVTNAGPTDATGVTVTDSLPPGAIFVSATPSGGNGTCTHDGAASGGVIGCELGDLPANGVVTIDVETTLDPSIASGAELTNTAEVSSDVQDDNPTNNTATSTVTATRIADVAVTKVDDPDPVVAGQAVSWTIVVANSGPSDAGAVTVLDSIPDGFTIESVSPSGCDVTGNDVACSLGAVAPGTPVEVVVVATASSTYVADGLANPVINNVVVTSPDDGNTSNDQAQTSTLVVERSDVAITKSAPTTVSIGDTITWTIDVVNAGPSVAEGVIVTDTIPPGLIVGPADINGTGCSLVGNDVTCNLGTLGSGATTQIVITGTVPANYLSGGNPATISNNASISTTSTDTDIGNNQAAVETVITEEADLNIAKSSQVIEVAAGEQLTWVIEVYNVGPADARDVVVTDALPAGFTVTNATADNGGSCDSAGTCQLGTIPPDQLITINVVGQVAADHAEGPIVNSASLTSASPDPVANNNTAEATVNVVADSDLTVSKTGPTSAVPGQPISYTVTILNNGPSDATGVQMNDTLPAGLVDATATPSTGSCSSATVCDIPVLPAGATATITIDATVDPDLTATTITNEVYALPENNEPNPDDNDAATTATVTPIADVSLTKVGDVNPVIAGTNLVWTLTATNDGPSTARDVVISDTLPPGVQLVAAPECGGDIVLECSIADLAAGASYSVTIEVAIDPDYYDQGLTNPLTNTATVSTVTPELDTSNNAATETTTVADLAGVAVGKSHEGFAVTAGETSTWLLTVVNTGPSSAQNVVVTDAIPDGTTFVSATASNGAPCSEAGGVLTCELGSVPVNDLVDVVVELDVSSDYVSAGYSDPIPNSATATSTTDDPNPADNTGTDTLDVVGSADVVATKTGPTEANAGDQVQWEITVTNNGPSVAEDVTIDDPAPAGVVIDATSPAGICDAFVTCQIGDLAPGASATVMITATIDSTWLIDSYPQPLSNAANASSPITPDSDPTNNTGYADTTVTETAALSVTKTDSPDPVVAGETLTWVVSITNDGPSIARDVIVDDPTPAGVTVTSATSSTGDGCTFAVNCTLASVAVGATETVTIVGIVDPSITAATGSITNVATVSTATNPADDLTASSDTAVENHVDLSIEKTDGGVAVTAGETVNWSIEVANDGPSDAPNTMVTDTLPAGLDPATVNVSVTPASAGACDASALPDLTCDLGVLAAGATASISVSAIVDSTYLADGNPNPIPNTAVITSDAVELDAANNSSSEVTPVNTAADLALTKSGPATITAGDQITWTIDVGNLGPSAATGVTITDTIPSGIIVDSATPGCTIDGQNISCDLARLAVAATHTITIVGTVPADYVAAGQPVDVTNGALATSDVPDPDTTNNSSQVPTTIDATVDLAVTKTVDPAEVAAGEAATWTVAVTNAGPSVATDVAVTDALPAGFTLASATADNGGACDAAATCLLGSLAPQETVVVTISGTVDPDFFTAGGASPIANTATVTSTEADSDEANNAATAELAVTSAADLVLTKTGAATLVPGTTTEYTIAVTNLGPSDALAATVADLLPPELTGVTLTPSQGTCTGGDCDLGTIPADGAVTITVTATVDADTTATTVTNTATTTSDTTDPDGTNNQGAVTADVVAEADVAIAKTESVDPVVAGQPLTWTIEATNAGPSTARNVIVSDTLPAGVTLVDAGACTGTTSLTCDAGDIAVGATATFDVTVTVNADYYTAGNPSPIANTATHTADTADPEPLNDEHTELTTVAAIAGVAVGKSADAANVSAGSEIVWTINVINSGPSDAQNVVVTDPVPAGLSVTAATFNGQDCAIGADIVCDLGVLPAGEAATITVTSSVDGAYIVDGQANPLQNLATATSDTDDPELGDNGGGDQVNITAADNVSVTKQGPTTATAGESIEWTVSVTNSGPSVAQNVVVSDPIPAGIVDIGAVADPAGSAACDPSVSCTIPTLAPGDTVTVTITGTVGPTWLVDGRDPTLVNTATVTSDADTDLSNNEAAASTTIDDRAAISITKVATPEPVNAGDEVTWTIEIVNAGPSAAAAVVVTDAVPDGVVVTDATASVGGCTFDVACELGALGVDQAATVTITGRVPASWFVDGGAATITNTATATTPTNPDEEVTADAVTTIAATADVSITKTDTGDPVVAGGPIRWVLTATNAGPSDSTATIVSDTLPDGLDLSTVTVSPASANCDTTGLPALSCDLGTLAAGASVAITVDSTLVSSYLVDGNDNPLSNGAAVAAGATIVDPNPDNNADVETTDVLPQADVSVVKSVSPLTVVAGEDVTFTMVVSNSGPSTATGIALADTLPAGVAIVSAVTDIVGSSPCPVAGQAILCPVGDLAVGDTVTATVVGTVEADYVATAQPNPIVNTATVTATSPDDVNTNNADSADVTVIDEADVAITKSASTSEVSAGTALGWTAIVTNAGPSVARSVTMSDLIPDGYDVESVTASNGAACDSSSCVLGDLEVGGSVTIEIAGTTDPGYNLGTQTNTATVDSATVDPNDANNTGTATVDVVPEVDLAVTKAGPAEFTPGEAVSYQVVIRNDGPSTATDVSLTEDYPSGFAVNSIVPSQGTCEAVSLCAIGTIEPGGQVTVQIDGTADPGIVDDFVNTVNAEASQADPDASNNTATVVSTVSPFADLSIAKDDVDDLVVAGEQVTWTLTATNAGPSVARDVAITDSLPPGTTLVSTSVPCDGTVDLGCIVGDLGPGESSTVTVVAAVDSGYYADGRVNPLLNAAEVATSTADPMLGNNSSTDTTTIAASAGLSIAKDANVASVVAGEAIEWTLTVHNAGPSTGQNVVVDDSLPDGVAFVSAASSNGGSCSENGGALSCALGDLAVGATVSIRVVADIDADYVSAGLTQPLLNAASVAGDTEDPFLGDNNAVDQVAVTDSADLNLAKTGPANVDAGETVTWQITVINNGPSVARDVTVDDPAPAGVTITEVTSTGGAASCTTAAVCDLGDIAPGDAMAINVTGVVDSTYVVDGRGDAVTNRASVSAATPDPAAADNTASTVTTIGESADVVAVKTASPDPVIAGRPVTWTIEVTNNGPSAARDLVVDDPAPAGTTVTAVGPAGACTFDATCNLDVLDAGESATFEITTTVDPGWFTEGGAASLTNTATISTITNGADTVAAEGQTAVDDEADLAVTKAADRVLVSAGESLSWTITVHNDGPSSALATAISDTIPAGVDAVTASPPTGVTCDTTSLPTLTCDLGDVADGATITIPVSATVDASYFVDGNTGPLNNEVVVASQTDDPGPGNNSADVSTQVANASGIAIGKSATPEVTAGETVTWTIEVTNSGPGFATGVTVSDPIPAGIEVAPDGALPSTGTCTIAAAVECDLGSVAPGATALISITGLVGDRYVVDTGTELSNTASVSTTSDDDEGDNEATAASTVVDQADLTVTKTVSVPGTPDGAGPAVAGAPVDWTITVTNAGPSTARVVELTDPIPAGVTVDSVTADGATCETTTTITCSIAQLGPSDPTAPVAVTVNVAATLDSDYVGAGLPSVLANTATASAETPDPTPSSATAVVPVAESSDLVIAKTTDAAEAVAGETMTWTVTVTNSGPSDARDVVVIDPAPPGVSFTDVSATIDGASCDVAATCILDALPAGASTDITLVGLVDPATPSGATIVNTATVSSATPDPVDGPDPVVETPVVTAADVSLSKRDATDPVVAGTSVYWSIEVRNDGPSAATNVIVSDQVPDGVAVVSISGDGARACDPTTGCEFDVIEDGGFRVVTIVGAVDPNYLDGDRPNPLVNTASVASADPDPNSDDNVADHDTTISGEAGLSISKSVDVDTAIAGSPITWTLTINNAGPSAAADVVVSDTIPAGVTVDSVTAPDGAECTDIADCRLGNIGVGGSVTVTVDATVDASAVIDGVTELINVATVASTTAESNLADNESTVTTPVAATADLSLVKTASGDVGAGGDVAWTLTVANAGPSTADAVTVTDELPAGLKLVSVTPDDDTVTCDDTIVCDLGRMEAGQVIVITVVTSTPPGAESSELVNTASVVSPTPDPDPSNNGGTATANALGAQIGLAKRLVGTPTHDGSGTFRVRFELVVVNTGSAPLSGVQVIDNLANRLADVTRFAVVSVASEDLTINPDYDGVENTGLLTGTDVLPVGASGVVVLDIDVVPGPSTPAFVNRAEASGSPATGISVTDRSADGNNVDPDGDGDPNDDDGPTRVPLEWTASIGAAKELDRPVVREEDGSFTVVFDIDVKNFGDVDLTDVQLVDDLSVTYLDAAAFSVISLTSDDLTVNPNFDGVDDTKLLAGTDDLPVGRGGTLLLTTSVLAVSSTQTFSNIVTASAADPASALVDDLSSAGSFGCDGDLSCSDPEVEPPDPGDSGGTDVTPPVTGAAPLGLIGVGFVLFGVGLLLVAGARRRRSDRQPTAA